MTHPGIGIVHRYILIFIAADDEIPPFTTLRRSCCRGTGFRSFSLSVRALSSMIGRGRDRMSIASRLRTGGKSHWVNRAIKGES